jgi:hypothetical protein
MTLETKVARAVRAAKPKGPTEFEIHARIAADLRRAGVRFFHCPNEGRRSARFSAGLAQLGVSAGVPDLVIVRPGGHACSRCLKPATYAELQTHTSCGDRCLLLRHSSTAALELKSKGCKPTAEQVAWLATMAAAGWLTGWADSYESARELLEGWGILQCGR